MSKLTQFYKTCGVHGKIMEHNSLGKFSMGGPKKLVTLGKEHESSLVIAKSVQKRDELKNMSLYLLPALNKASSNKENQCLKNKESWMTTEFLGRSSKFKITNFSMTFN